MAETDVARRRIALAAKVGGVGLWDWDCTTGAVFINDQLAAQIGYDLDEVEWSHAAWAERVPPDDLPPTLEQLHAYLDGRVDRYAAEFRFRHRDGSWRWIESRGELRRDETGRPQRMLGSHLDVTERRQADEQRCAAIDAAAAAAARTRALHDASPECIKLVSADGRLLDMNPAGLRMVGATSLYQVIGRPVLDLIHPEDRCRFKALHDRVALHGESGRLEFRVFGLSGQQRWMETHSVPLRDPDGRVASVLSVTRDFTERHAAELERRAMERRLLQAPKLEAIGALSGGIAHDFNYILAAITGNLELALHDVGERSPARESLEEIRLAADCARSMVRQILAFSRTEPVQRRALRPEPQVDEVVRFMRAMLPSTLAIEVASAPDLPPVLADPTQLHQVLVNLCTNGAQAMEGRTGAL